MRAAVALILISSFVSALAVWWFLWQQMPPGMPSAEAEAAAAVGTAMIHIPLLLVFSIIVLTLKKHSRTVRQGLTSEPRGREKRKTRSWARKATDIALTLALLDDDDKKKKQQQRRR